MAPNLTRAAALVAFAFIHASASAQTRPVNDTGVISCTNATWGAVTCESVNATLPAQDAAFGRDALAVAGGLNKLGSGRRGFDFTKIGMDGSVAPAAAVWGNSVGQFRCVRDNTTGLVWENYREIRWWRDDNPATNGGFVGVESVPSSTQQYAEAANSASRCNRTTWRLPTARELVSITSFESTGGLVWSDFNGFFDQLSGSAIAFWTSQSNPAFPEHALLVMINRGDHPAVTRKLEGHTNKTVGQWTVLVSSQ